MSLHFNNANGGCGLPGVDEITGKNVRSSQKESPKNVLSRRGLIKCKGKMVIFRMLTHGENDTNRTGSTRRRSGLWNHLIWSWEQKVVIFFLPGTHL